MDFLGDGFWIVIVVVFVIAFIVASILDQGPNYDE
jgi:hypothetical protein